MNDAFKKTERYVRETGMLSAHDHVVLGVSGGADSVFLFYAVKELAVKWDLKLMTVHVHHGIRGRTADGDAAFVEELCGREGIPCRVVRADVPEYARRRKLSLEEAGRLIRREAFFRAADDMGGAKIALAHHRDDLAETVIFRLARGTGLSGLAGIRPVQGDVIHPLLPLGRAEIRQALLDEGIAWREDETNEEDGPVRNRIRHHVLPYLEEEVHRGAARHIAEAAERAAQVSDFMEAECRRRFDRYVRQKEEGAVIAGNLAGEHPVMQDMILKKALASLIGGEKDIGSVHVGILRELLSMPEGKAADLPRGIRALRVREGLRLSYGAEREAQPSCVPLPVREEAEGQASFGGYIFRWSLLEGIPEAWRNGDGRIAPPEKRCTKWFDYDMIKNSPVLRCRQEGDYLTVSREGGHKSLSDYLTDQKVPREERSRLALAADGPEIMWVVGLRIGYRYRITPETRRILRIEMIQDESGEMPRP